MASDPAASQPMSPQQIMRARFKQQMLPPRTWKQQESRRAQLEAESHARNAQNQAAYTAAAALASTRASARTNPILDSQTASAGEAARQPGGSFDHLTRPNRSNIEPFGQPDVQPKAQPRHRPHKPSLTRSDFVPQSPSAAAAGAASSASSPVSSPNDPNLFRPPLVRRGSSTSSVSLAAAQAVQSPSGRPQAARRRLSSVSSTSSSLRNSFLESAAPFPSPQSHSQAQSFAQASAQASQTRAEAQASQTAQGNHRANQRPLQRTNQRPDHRFNPRPTHGLSQGPNQGLSQGPTQGLNQGLSQGPAQALSSLSSSLSSPPPSSSPSSSSSSSSQPTPVAQPVRQSSTFTASRAPARRPMNATAAARASVAKPITIAPREPLSAKFVSSLTQALRQRTDTAEKEAQAEQDALASMVPAMTSAAQSSAAAAQSRSSFDSVRSVRSGASVGNGPGSAPGSAPGNGILGSSVLGNANGVGQVGSASAARVPDYKLPADSFIELMQQQQALHQQQLEQRRKVAEDNKAKALQAAVAAGERAEENMANIHIQVNEAVRSAQQRRDRRERLKKYRPAASWTTRRVFKPPLRRLQTSESGIAVSEGTTPTTETPHNELVPGTPSRAGTPSRGTPPPGSLAAFGLPDHHISSTKPAATYAPFSSSSSSSSNTAAVAGSTGAQGGVAPTASQGSQGSQGSQSSQRMSSETVPASPSTPRIYGQRMPFTLRQKPRPSKAVREAPPVLPALSTSPKSVSSTISGPPSSMEMNSGFYVHPSHSQPVVAPTSSEPQQLAQRMPMTLRGHGRRKRFNEDKPWKGHREIAFMNVRERKRYESLWAANRDLHLPYVYVPPRYQKAWDEALRRLHPELFKGVPAEAPENSNSTSDAATAPASAPSSAPSASASASALASGPATGPAGAASSDSVATGSSSSASKGQQSQLLGPPIHQLSPSKSQRSFQSTASGTSYVSAGTEFSETWPEGSAGSSSVGGGVDAASIGGASSTMWPDYFEDPAPLDVADVESVEVEADNIDIDNEVKKRSDEVHGYLVSRLWRRSRLPEETLAQIWDLVDLNKDGTLERSGFVVGMWLCDQCLYGRKLPAKVPQEVWQSVGKLNLKIRVKQKRSKIGYVRKLPNFFGSALGHTMHGGRKAVKRAVQTATSHTGNPRD